MPRTPAKPKKPKLLSGGNPQVPKATGEAPVTAYITAMPGWKRQVGQKLDALISRNVPKAVKAVKYNCPRHLPSPFAGEGARRAGEGAKIFSHAP